MPAGTAQKWRPPKPKQKQIAPTAVQATTKTTTTSPKQLTDQDLVTQQQSLTIVKTLLGATFGCVTYLRGLLSEDSFEDAIIGGAPPPLPPSTSSSKKDNINDDDGNTDFLVPVSSLDTGSNGMMTVPPSSQQPQAAGGQGGEAGGQQQPKGLRIKQIKANHSPEADKIRKWINESVMDAVEKQCLKACVFGIYLDPDDPSNMVETITVSFNYPPISATSSARIPELTIAKTFGDLNLEGSNEGVAATEGNGAGVKIFGGGNMDVDGPGSSNLKTVGEVKKAIRKVIRNLIISCQNLAELPSRRWVSMKLIYMDNAPEDYEPPHFVPADSETKEWHFSTHTPYQAPEIDTTGWLATRHHAFDLKITSIVDHLPPPVVSQFEDANKFGMPFPPTASEVRKRKTEDDALQREDAAKRRYVWAAKARAQIDPEYADADGEEDDAMVGTSKPKNRPMGVKDDSGNIGPYQATEFPPSPCTDRVAVRPDRAKSLLFGKRDERESFGSQTDALLDHVARKLAHPATQASIVQTQALTNEEERMEVDPVENAALENQESIQSFSQTRHQSLPAQESIQTLAKQPEAQEGVPDQAQPPSSQAEAVRLNFTSCPCGDASQDPRMIQCLTCKLDIHVCCDGWPEPRAFRKSKKYICLTCRMVGRKGTPEEVKELVGLMERVWPTIALIRRTMWIAKEMVEFEAKGLHSKLGCKAGDFKSVFDRLANENFVIEKPSDGPKKGKPKVFVWNSEKTQQAKYATYFSPNTLLEQEMCGWSFEFAKKLTGRNGNAKFDHAAKQRELEQQQQQLQLQQQQQHNQPTDQTRIEPFDAATAAAPPSKHHPTTTSEHGPTAIAQPIFQPVVAASATNYPGLAPQAPMTPARSQARGQGGAGSGSRPDRMSLIRTPLDLSTR